MKLIAHRGLWKARDNSNTLNAFQTAFKKGMGIETDLRSISGELYLSHDLIQQKEGQPSFQSLINLASDYPQLPLFLNIKEDGLLELLKPYLPTLEQMNVVFFDMSIPELIQYTKHFSPSHLCTRMSEFETQPSAIEFCDWIWVDCFYKEFNFEQIKELVRLHDKKWAFVSPELHGRNQKQFWEELLSVKWLPDEKKFLCTDLAEIFSKEQHD